MENLANSIPIGPTGKLQNNIAMPYQFTIGGLIAESWQRVKGTKKTFWGAILLCLAIYIALSLLETLAIYLYAQYVNPNDTKIPFIITRVLDALITLPLSFGIILLAVYRSVNLPIKVKQIFEPYRFYWKILAAMIILYAGAALIIAGTIYLWVFLPSHMINMTQGWPHYYPILIGTLGSLIAFYFIYSLINAPMLIIEKQLGVFRSLKASFFAFNQHGLKIIAAVFCMIVICFISMITFGIGLIWTFPMLYNFMGILYRIQFGVGEHSK